jgi:lipopolysaccharide transport system ATP-binding protein
VRRTQTETLPRVTDIAISVHGLGKRYRIHHEGTSYGRLTESMASAIRAPLDRLRGTRRGRDEWLWAVRGVSFDVPEGDVVGVIGRNGAGKTTLLKLLSRITEPTEGRATLRGRVGSLLEVGTGFHPELTGRENVFLSGAILGMRKEETLRNFDEIVAFSGVEQFIDTPVKRYSSGMQVRLGFAVAAHLETEILIVDEVLAVGDAEFQRKCLTKMGGVAKQGRTVIFVSHNMAAVEALCSSGLLLDRGAVVAAGQISEVLGSYDQAIASTLTESLASRADRRGDGRLRVVSIEAVMRTGADSEIRLRYVAASSLSNVEMQVNLYSANREAVAQLGNGFTGQAFEHLPPTGTIVCKLPNSAVMPGTYTVDIYCTVTGIVADWLSDAAELVVAEGAYFPSGKLPLAGYGHVIVAQDWAVETE